MSTRSRKGDEKEEQKNEKKRVVGKKGRERGEEVDEDKHEGRGVVGGVSRGWRRRRGEKTSISRIRFRPQE